MFASGGTTKLLKCLEFDDYSCVAAARGASAAIQAEDWPDSNTVCVRRNLKSRRSGTPQGASWIDLHGFVLEFARFYLSALSGQSALESH